MNSLPRVVVLGAGPAGAGAAFQLRRLGRADVTLVEQRDVVGGNAGSFERGGLRLDYGSHRLHPACDPEILADIRSFLGDDLLDRPRHGRIYLRGRWIHFPLKPHDLLLRLDRRFAVGVLGDMMGRRSNGNGHGTDTFASVLEANLGGTICRDFYFPYARKIWGREPEQLSGIQARRRVSAGSFRKLARKVMSAVPGFKPPGAGRFYYPRRGYGQITEAYAEAAQKLGAELMLGWSVAGLKPVAGKGEDGWLVELKRDGERRELQADYVWSTLPINLLARMISPPPPEEVKRAAQALDYRSMLLVYLELDVDQFTEYDAHYFPAAEIAITRLSEPKNYAVLSEPRGRTTLCAELPCTINDQYWQMSDAELGNVVARDLERAGIPLQRAPVSVHVRRLPHAYPIYLNGYETAFNTLDAWAASLPRLLTYGRQGLFAHDNTHHALFMAYRAVDCLEEGSWNDARWQDFRKVFETHVVED
jgi:protoporphyrinogen oxidase